MNLLSKKIFWSIIIQHKRQEGSIFLFIIYFMCPFAVGWNEKRNIMFFIIYGVYFLFNYFLFLLNALYLYYYKKDVWEIYLDLLDISVVYPRIHSGKIHNKQTPRSSTYFMSKHISDDSALSIFQTICSGTIPWSGELLHKSTFKIILSKNMILCLWKNILQ